MRDKKHQDSKGKKFGKIVRKWAVSVMAWKTGKGKALRNRKKPILGGNVRRTDHKRRPEMKQVQVWRHGLQGWRTSTEELGSWNSDSWWRALKTETNRTQNNRWIWEISKGETRQTGWHSVIRLNSDKKDRVGEGMMKTKGKRGGWRPGTFASFWEDLSSGHAWNI